MKYSPVLLLGGAAFAAADLFCEGAVQDALGNYFCPPSVKQIKYTGLDVPGKYRRVSQMDNSGTCVFEDREYSGPIAPYDEDLSLHFRGPLQLHQVAVYLPGSTATKSHSKRHGHQHLHKKHQHQHEERAVGEVVYATINGQVQSWTNTYAGPTPDAPADAPPAPTKAPQKSADKPAGKPGKGSKSPVNNGKKVHGGDDTYPTAPSGDFVRSAYYEASSGTAEGLVFLANVGDPQISGTWDTVWGSSLGYVDENGASCAASATVLKDTLLDDNKEIAIFSDIPCDESCGAYRPDSVAYKGFAGASKVFIVQMTMPLSGKTGWNMDMPSYWLLNAAIPRTGQYTSCSCWQGDFASPLDGGCGELDVLEILSSGDCRGKSTFHFANGVGDSHYFDRPTEGPITLALVTDPNSASVSIKELDNFAFDQTLTADQVQAMIDDATGSIKMAFAH
ncbi:TOS1 protein [Poronia punctata]|nr:TOS1 protein [Poronia punctata]